MEYSHEIIVPNDDIPFKLFIFEGGEGSYIRHKHWHRSIEIFVVFEGKMVFYLNEKSYPLHSGEFMLVNSNEVHSIHAPEKNQTLVVQIPLSAFERYYTDNGYIYFSHSPRVQDEEVMKLLEEMYRVYAAGKTGYEFAVQSLFYRLLYLLVSKYAQMSYKTYLDDLRLGHAYHDLVNSELTIEMIAEKNGFAGSKAFARAFRERYGILPSEYRKKNKEKLLEINSHNLKIVP